MKKLNLPSNQSKVFILFAIAFAMLFTACKDNTTNPDPEPEPEVSKQIGTQGGTITSKDGNLTLDIPAGALSGTETITISKIDPDELGPEFDEIKEILGIAEAYELGPDGLTFAKPVTVTTPSDQKALQPDSSLKLNAVFLFTSEQGKVISLDSLRLEPAGENTDAMQVRGELIHFSTVIETIGERELFTTVITGIPDLMVVGGSAEIHVEVHINSVLRGLIPYEELIVDGEYFFEGQRFSDLLFKETSPGVYEATATITCLHEGYNYLALNTETRFRNNEGFFQLYGISPNNTEINCIKPEPPENVLPVGVIDLTIAEAEALVGILFPSNSSKAVAKGSSSNQKAAGDFGSLKGSYPAVIAGAEGIVVIDLLTNEVLLEVDDLAGTEHIGPLFGVVGFIDDANNPGGNAQLVMYGANGGKSINVGGNEPVYAYSGVTLYDIYPAGGSMLANFYTEVSPDFGVHFSFSFKDLRNASYDIDNFVFDGEVVSAWAPNIELEFEGPVVPVLIIDRAVESGLYYKADIKNTAGFVKRIADIGLDARKIRCIATNEGGYICAVTLFGDDEIAIITWTGEDEPVVAGTAPAGDGPVDMGLSLLENGNVAIVTTGFNDNTVTETEVSPDGSVVSNVTRVVLDGCVNPGHAIYVRDGEGLKIVGTCYTSGNYFIMKSEL